jgi:hypothetical protein
MSCSVVDLVKNGFAYSHAVESELQSSAGLKPSVGFSWHNGRFTEVTVAYPGVVENKTLRELADEARTVVAKNFKQAPDNIVLSFSVGKSETGRRADVR